MFKLSIITINFNNLDGLQKTIQSVSSQSSKKFEYIIIDGGSTDGSQEYIQENADRIAYWVSEKDNGIYHAMNKGIVKARGDYLMFLNSGDVLTHENVVEIFNNNLLEKKGAVDIYYGDIFLFDNMQQIKWCHPEKLTISFFKKNNINHQSSFIRADLFKEFGLYPPKFRLAGDHWFFLLSFLNGKVFKHINVPLVNYQVGGIGFTQRMSYESEMQQMWKELVPEYVDELVDEFLEIEYAKPYPFLKIISPIHEILIYRKKEILTALILIAVLIFFLNS